MAELAAEKQLIVGTDCTRAIAADTGIPRSTVRDILKRVDPLVQEFKVFKRDEMLTAHQHAFFDAYEDLMRRSEKGDTVPFKPGERRDLSVSMGIHAQRSMELAGHPVVSLSYNVHEHRHELGPLMEKMAVAARVLAQQPTAPARLSYPTQEAANATVDAEEVSS